MFRRKSQPKLSGDERIRDLYSEDSSVVINAVNALIANTLEDSTIEAELIEIVVTWEADDSYASLWSMVALGWMGSRRAMPVLLSVLDSDADIWCEAAAEALVHIVRRHGEDALDPVEDFIERRLDNDPYNATIFAYEPIAAMKHSERAKDFLVWCFREDEKWKASLAGDLANFHHPRLTQLFRPVLEFAIRSGDKIDENELREAYCVADGVKFKRAKELELWEEPWEERWQWKLKELGKSDREIAQMDKDRFKNIKEDDVWEKQWQEEKRLRDSHPIRDFNIEEWVRIRARTGVEEDFDEALRFLGFPDLVTVEAVQIWISRASRPRDVLEDIFRHEFPSFEAEHSFLHKFDDLWNTTPREEFQGLSPEDMIALPEAQRHNKRVDQKRSELLKMTDEDDA